MTPSLGVQALIIAHGAQTGKVQTAKTANALAFLVFESKSFHLLQFFAPWR